MKTVANFWMSKYSTIFIALKKELLGQKLSGTSMRYANQCLLTKGTAVRFGTMKKLQVSDRSHHRRNNNIYQMDTVIKRNKVNRHKPQFAFIPRSKVSEFF